MEPFYPYPYIQYSPVYISIHIAEFVVWDDEDENDRPDSGDTVETILAHIENNLQGLITALSIGLSKAP